MVQTSSMLGRDFIFLVQTVRSSLKNRLLKEFSGKNIRFISVQRSDDIIEQHIPGQIVTFIIGSDVQDPVQSAQRLHVVKKDARIVLLSKSAQSARVFKEAIRFSPFIGTNVICIDESNEAELQRLLKILNDSLVAEKYRIILEASNSQISTSKSSGERTFNQHFINKLMDIAPVGIAIVNRQGKVLGWNREAASIFGKNESQILGTSLSRLFSHREGARLDTYINKVFHLTNSSELQQALELERKTKPVSWQILHVTAALFTYSRGMENALILVINDISKRKQAENELHEMNETLEKRVKERTASLLSYQDQLRSLGSRLSQAEEMERQRLATELHDNLGQMLVLAKMKIDSFPKNELTEKASAEMKDIKEGVHDALVYTRDLMSDLKPPPTLNKEDIRPSIEWLANMMKKYELRVIVEDDGLSKPVENDVRLTLVQCVRELLLNIVKHAGVDEGRVGITRLDDMVVIEVRDNGKGFDSKVERFVSHEGGFGLFNIRERIDLLEGSVEIESESGNGTRVTLRAPVTMEAKKRDSPEIDNIEQAHEEETKRDKIRVLLVDDHEMMREGLRNIVDKQSDITVVAEASDGKEAISEALKSSPDVVVMDVNMPVMDGIEATQKLLEKLPGVRVIALSLHDHQDVIDNMRKAGATAYLTKNEAFETLCATIRSEANLVKV